MGHDPGTDHPRFEVLVPVEEGGGLTQEASESGGVWKWLKDRRHRFPIHPMTGLLILGSDWLLFPGTVASFGCLTAVLSLFGFFLGFFLTAWSQAHFAEERMGVKLVLKSFVGGLIVGVPFPVAGTLAGAGSVLLARLYGLRPDQALAKAAGDLRAMKAGRSPAPQPVPAPPTGSGRDPNGATRMSDREELASLRQERGELQRQLDELYREYPRSPGYGISGGEPAGIEVIGRQLDRIDARIAALERKL